MAIKSYLMAFCAFCAARVACAGPSPEAVDLDGVPCAIETFPAQTTAYDYARLKRDKRGRGRVAWRSDTNTVTVSWRYLSSDQRDIAFDVYRDGGLVAANVTASTQIDDVVPDGGVAHCYTLKANGATLAETTSRTTLGYIEIPLPPAPPGGETPDGTSYTYFPGDCSVGDVDGDGEYEIFLKWDPTAKGGFWRYSGETYYECLKLDGTSLWRIRMGRNIRSGEHCSDFSVADFDGDGRAEMIVKTADGTVDAKGTVIGDGKADWRNEYGQVLDGPEFISVFDGQTGKVLATADYLPARGPIEEWKWTKPRGWGDQYGNRVERFLFAPAYLDGENLSCVACRGIYKRSALTAYDWNGKSLSVRWTFDTTNTLVSTDFQGQGFHSLRVGDVDGDGRDEIVYGAMAVDHDGTPLYTTKLGHGDAMHLLQMDPLRRGLQVFVCLESSPYGCALYEAATGEILWRKTAGQDTPRAVAGDLDGANPGCEAWAAAALGLFDQHGNRLVPYNGGYQGLSFSHLVWWTGSLERSLLPGSEVCSYSLADRARTTIAKFEDVTTINSTKSVPCLSGDLLGDWREEVLMARTDGRALRLFLSPLPTAYRFHTFLEDPVYRHSIAHQNGCYNQPTQAGFYFGPDLKGHGIWFRGTYVP